MNWAARKEVPVTSDFQASGRRLETQLAELASKNPKAGWLLDEYYGTEKQAKTALNYVLQYGGRRGYTLPHLVKLETQPTALLNAYAARDSLDMPFIHVKAGLRFLLMMLNYGLVWATFKNTISGARSVKDTLFTIANGYWPSSIDLISETDAFAEFFEDERDFITAWLPSQMFFIVAHEFAHHILWYSQQDSPPIQKVRLLNGREIEVYCPSQKDQVRADDIAFDIWEELDSTLAGSFQAFTAGGLGALFGYFRILEEYTNYESIPSDLQPPAVDRYDQFKTRLFNSGRIHSLQAMEETWTMTKIITEALSR